MDSKLFEGADWIASYRRPVLTIVVLWLVIWLGAFWWAKVSVTHLTKTRQTIAQVTQKALLLQSMPGYSQPAPPLSVTSLQSGLQTLGVVGDDLTVSDSGEAFEVTVEKMPFAQFIRWYASVSPQIVAVHSTIKLRIQRLDDSPGMSQIEMSISHPKATP